MNDQSPTMNHSVKVPPLVYIEQNYADCTRNSRNVFPKSSYQSPQPSRKGPLKCPPAPRKKTDKIF